MTEIITPARFRLALPDGLILRPRNRGLAPVSFGGEFRFIVLDGATMKVKRETDWQPNLVTNHGLDVIGGGGSNPFASFCRIGTGNTAPANTDTALVSQSASTSSAVASTSTNAGASNYETLWTTTFQFALGAVVGNMAEIGVGETASGLNLCSRALIVDGLGSPTTITVLITEILQVVYRFTVYPNLVDATGTVTIGGVSYNYVSRTKSIATVLNINPNAFSGYFTSVISPQAYPSTSTLGAVTSSGPSGSSAAFDGSTISAYVTANYYRDLTLTASIAAANAAGGIAAVAFQVGTGGAVFQNQVSFDKTAGGGPIPKDGTKALSIVFRQPYARH